MAKKSGNKASKRKRPPLPAWEAKQQTAIIICFAVLTTLVAALFFIPVIRRQMDANALRREAAALPAIALPGTDAAPTTGPSMLRLPDRERQTHNDFDTYMRETNPDFIGWLSIQGTEVDFPVVRGNDNVRYLNTTFAGSENVMGAIFMDYRNVGEAPHILIYGHDAVDTLGNVLMFGGLRFFLEDAHLARYPVITFMTYDSLAEFDIFSARIVYVTDAAFRHNFDAPGSWADFLEQVGAPADAEQVITLSTCVGAAEDIRLIVQGVLRRIIPIASAVYGADGWEVEVG